MKTSKTLIALVLALAGLMAAGSASAWHHRHGPRVSIGFGFGYPGPYYYPPYSYSPYSYYPHYYAAPVVIQRQPTVYIEQHPPSPAIQAPAPASAYWYYCTDTRAYYPYVKECGSGWQRVAPQPG